MSIRCQMPDGIVHSSSSSASSSIGSGLYTSGNGNHALPQSPRGSVGDSNCEYANSPQASPQSNYVTTTGMNDMHAGTQNVFYSSSGMLPLNSNATPSVYSNKTVISSAPSSYQQRQPAQSPASQTPGGIPDIILTGMRLQLRFSAGATNLCHSFIAAFRREHRGKPALARVHKRRAGLTQHV